MAKVEDGLVWVQRLRSNKGNVDGWSRTADYKLYRSPRREQKPGKSPGAEMENALEWPSCQLRLFDKWLRQGSDAASSDSLFGLGGCSRLLPSVTVRW